MQRRGIILYNISIYHVYKEEGHRPIVLNQCRKSATNTTNTDPELKQHRASVSLPSKHKTSAQHLYNVGQTSSTLVRPCTNALQMPWAKDAQQASFKSWPSIQLTQKRHPLNGSCSPERCDISALTQQTQGADPTLR